MTTQTLQQLREDYPTFVPTGVAAELLGLSQRQLSHLVAEGREPFASIGANIGLAQKYTRVYTERLIRYLTGDDMSR
jgi:hypothetical protein